MRALVDSGSTHSFLSTDTARRLHLQPLFRPGLEVTVANGDRVTSLGVCKAVRVFIDKEEFIMDLFVIPLEGYDMVLGVHWLRTLGPILWDSEHGSMSCWRDDHRVIWRGVSTQRSAPLVQAIDTKDLMMVLLQEFDDVFATPTGLPPPRHHNHRIHLLPDTAPVAVRL